MTGVTQSLLPALGLKLGKTDTPFEQMGGLLKRVLAHGRLPHGGRDAAERAGHVTRDPVLYGPTRRRPSATTAG
jgi:hypothetical protein